MSKSFVALRLIILLTTSFLLTWGTVTHAYWLDEDHATSTINDLREYAPPSDKKDIFTVPFYDGSSNKMDDSTPILLPHSDYFIPADIINANLPIFGLFSHPAPPAKDPLANLLYANLKLKKLLEEYAATQQSAIEYLGQHTSSPGQFQALLPQQKQLPQNKEKTPDNHQSNIPTYKPILSYYNNLRSLREKISSNPRALVLAESNQQEQGQTKISAPILEPYKFSRSRSTGITSSQQLPGYTSHYTTYQRNRQTASLAIEQEADAQKQKDTDSRKNELRLDTRNNFERFIISFHRYIMNHPQEAAFYFIIIILAFSFAAKIIRALLGF